MPKLEQMQTPSRLGARRARSMRVSSSLAEINVVPLVDIMLVLLVIFMVAAPMMQQGFGVQLPKSQYAPALSTEPVTVSVPVSFRRDARVRVNEELIPLALLAERVRQALIGHPNQNVVVAADGATMFQELVTVLDTLQKGGVEKVGLQTQPVTERRQ